MSADGTWKISLKTPMGPQPATLTLSTNGSDLSGSIEAPPPLGKLDLSEGTANGDALSWKVAMTVPMPMTLDFTATVSDDTISGDVKMGAMGNATFEGNRT